LGAIGGKCNNIKENRGRKKEVNKSFVGQEKNAKSIDRLGSAYKEEAGN